MLVYTYIHKLQLTSIPFVVGPMSFESWQPEAEETDEDKSIGARIGRTYIKKQDCRDGALRHGSGKTFNLIKPKVPAG